MLLFAAPQSPNQVSDANASANANARILTAKIKMADTLQQIHDIVSADGEQLNEIHVRTLQHLVGMCDFK